MTETEDLCTRIEALLDEERAALRAGDLAALGDIVTRKEALVAGLERVATAGDAARLERIARAAGRNRDMLGGALKGLRAARQRIDMVRRAGQTLDTYDRLGRARAISMPESRHESRA